MTQPNSDLNEWALKKAGWVADGMAKGGNRPERAGLTGRRVSSLVPWGDPRGGLRLRDPHMCVRQTGGMGVGKE